MQRCAQHPSIAGDAALDDAALAHLADADVELKALLDEIDRAVEQLHLDLQQRKAPGQLGQRRREPVATETGAAAEAQQAARRRLFARNCFAHQLDVFDDPLRPLMDDLALRGQGHVARRAVE